MNIFQLGEHMTSRRIESAGDPMAYLMIALTNENDIWEGDVFGSANGIAPSTEKFHVILGEGPEAKAITVERALELVGWAIADQRKIDEPFIWEQGEGARRIITGAHDKTEVVVNISAGGLVIHDTLAILQRGAKKRDLGTD